MSHSPYVLVATVDPGTGALTLRTRWNSGNALANHDVKISIVDAVAISRAISESPLRSDLEHTVSIDSVATEKGSYSCRLRFTSSGKRVTKTVAISQESHAVISSVLRSNIVSEGYVPE